MNNNQSKINGAIILGYKKFGPIFAAIRTGLGKQLIFRCPSCGSLIFHGAVSSEFGAGNGHRVSHCDDINCQLKENGYIIREVSDASLAGYIPKKYLH
ncbi:MAG: hypothetical protein HGJ94_06430 [Desulfosarcina sp.]|nr:hypothetical protein [Desulfosarcina sp.]